MTKHTVLALDLGTTTGWAMRLPDGERLSGFVAFRSGRYEGGGMRYLRFRRWLDEFHPRPAEVHFEEVRRHLGTDAAHVYGGLLAQLTAWCEEHALPYQGHPVGAIKRHATGRGNADKAAMLAAAPDHIADDNEADAWHLLDLVLSECGGASIFD